MARSRCNGTCRHYREPHNAGSSVTAGSPEPVITTHARFGSEIERNVGWPTRLAILAVE